MTKTKVTIITHDHWYTLLKYVDDRIGPAEFLLQEQIMTKLTSDWKDTAIPMLTEYYSVLHLLGKRLEEPYDTIERYEHLKKKIQEQGKEGIPIEDVIFAEITNAITIIDTLKERLRDIYKLPMEAH
jgi:hypothetical protein